MTIAIAIIIIVLIIVGAVAAFFIFGNKGHGFGGSEKTPSEMKKEGSWPKA